jgi:large subunit ribosomal protein L25
VTTGDAAPGSLINIEHNTLQVEAEATHIPSEVKVSIEGLAVGTQVLAREIELPAGVVLHLAPETLIVHVAAAPTAEQMEAAEPEADTIAEGETREEAAESDSESE